MPIHDWKNAPSGLFHHFHQDWSLAICHALNAGLLPKGFYALVEQHAVDVVPDVLTLQRRRTSEAPSRSRGGIALAEAPPKTRIVSRGSETEVYAEKANKIVIRAKSSEVVSVLEIVSPGNKHSRLAIRKFVDKSVELLRNGIHLLIVDLLPPTPRDPRGLHQLIWSEVEDGHFRPPRGKPLNLVSYCSGFPRTAFIEPLAVGDKLPEMPVFLDIETYVRIPLEESYAATWKLCPEEFRDDVLRSAR